ncbi:MAG: S-methyl-5'-thioadenosine phosphorylase [Chloroflexi bacterium]|nr:MAG: S-methyl-5'-thioadenosine phosphorylase [Chloroflexota bacterium]
MEKKAVLGIIGGSGIYAMPGLEDVEEFDLNTPFGKPSTPLVVGTLEGTRTAFLARHGAGHSISPSEINYRANIYAMKSLGVERIVGISACGSLREDFAPGDIVVADQLFDFTRNRKRTFFEGGLVVHISIADPFCPDLSNMVAKAADLAGGKVHRGGGMITIEGPRFSTKAESNTFRSWGLAVIGMTSSPEAFLAREAEICYAVMAHVTDYDVWHVSEKPVTVEMVIETLQHNAETAKKTVRNLAKDLKLERECTCGTALSSAVITNPSVIPAEVKERLSLLVGKYLK